MFTWFSALCCLCPPRALANYDQEDITKNFSQTLAQLKLDLKATADNKEKLTAVGYSEQEYNRAKTAEHTMDFAKKQAPASRQTVLLSDIDNTFLTTRDARYHCADKAYPGIKALFNAIQKNQDSSLLYFVTAKPGNDESVFFKSYSDANRSGTALSLRKAGIEKPRVLYGDASHCLRTPYGLYSRLAQQKIDNVKKIMKEHPGCQIVFFGDNGEADVSVAQALLKQFPDNIKKCFIHNVRKWSRHEKYQLQADNVCLYDSVISATKMALGQSLITSDDVASIIQSVINELTLDDQYTFSHDAVVNFNNVAHEIKKEIQKSFLDNPQCDEWCWQLENKKLSVPVKNMPCSIM